MSERVTTNYCKECMRLAKRLALAEKMGRAARLKCNTRWDSEKRFNGEWVVIPKVDFDTLRAAHKAFEESRGE